MAVLRRRTRLLTVRLSSEEYEALHKVSAAEGARSLSEFARTAILQFINARTGTRGSLTGDLTALGEQLEQIDDVIKDLSTRIERVLGKTHSEQI